MKNFKCFFVFSTSTHIDNQHIDNWFLTFDHIGWCILMPWFQIWPCFFDLMSSFWVTLEYQQSNCQYGGFLAFFDIIFAIQGYRLVPHAHEIMLTNFHQIWLRFTHLNSQIRSNFHLFCPVLLVFGSVDLDFWHIPRACLEFLFPHHDFAFLSWKTWVLL